MKVTLGCTCARPAIGRIEEDTDPVCVRCGGEIRPRQARKAARRAVRIEAA